MGLSKAIHQPEFQRSRIPSEAPASDPASEAPARSESEAESSRIFCCSRGSWYCWSFCCCRCSFYCRCFFYCRCSCCHLFFLTGAPTETGDLGLTGAPFSTEAPFSKEAPNKKQEQELRNSVEASASDPVRSCYHQYLLNPASLEHWFYGFPDSPDCLDLSDSSLSSKASSPGVQPSEMLQNKRKTNLKQISINEFFRENNPDSPDSSIDEWDRSHLSLCSTDVSWYSDTHWTRQKFHCKQIVVEDDQNL